MQDLKNFLLRQSQFRTSCRRMEDELRHPWGNPFFPLRAHATSHIPTHQSWHLHATCSRDEDCSSSYDEPFVASAMNYDASIRPFQNPFDRTIEWRIHHLDGGEHASHYDIHSASLHLECHSNEGIRHEIQFLKMTTKGLLSFWVCRKKEINEKPFNKSVFP